MKQVKLNTTMAGPQGINLAGSVVEVDDETAAILVAGGAIVVDEAREDFTETTEAGPAETGTAPPQKRGASTRKSVRR